jgi:hypothetical protein
VYAPARIVTSGRLVKKTQSGLISEPASMNPVRDYPVAKIAISIATLSNTGASSELSAPNEDVQG